MPYAIELFLDDDAEHRVREIWAVLDAHGITSLAGIPDSDHHPHVSLSVFEDCDPAAIVAAAGPVLADCAGLALPLAPLGFFLTAEAPAFLGVVPSERLLTLHRAVHQAIEPLAEGIWPYYRPDALLPHCTLAVGVTDKPALTRILDRFALPIPAVVAGAHLVELPGGHTRTLLR